METTESLVGAVVMQALPEVKQVVLDEFVINGCSARCADISALSAQRFVVFDPSTIPIDWEGLEL